MSRKRAILICPGCRGKYSWDAWSNDAEILAFADQWSRIPRQLHGLCKRYFGLFRGTNELTWGRLAGLAEMLADMVAAGHVQHGHRPARSCPVTVWADAMQKILDYPPKDLPLVNHNYLKSIAYGKADDADKANERQVVAAERKGNPHRTPDAGSTSGAVSLGECIEAFGGMTQEEMRAIRLKNKERAHE